MPHVKIYSTSWCAFCRAEKQFLSEHGIQFEDVNVEADPKEAEEMIALSNQMGVPVTRITHDDNTVTHRVGFDQDWLTSQLGLPA
jgi:glutaredoxin